MTTDNFYRADIDFYKGDKKICFSVIHNLPDIEGMSIDCAVSNWLARTKTFTDKSLCKYVMSKDESFICLTQKQYDRLNK